MSPRAPNPALHDAAIDRQLVRTFNCPCAPRAGQRRNQRNPHDARVSYHRRAPGIQVGITCRSALSGLETESTSRVRLREFITPLGEFLWQASPWRVRHRTTRSWRWARPSYFSGYSNLYCGACRVCRVLGNPSFEGLSPYTSIDADRADRRHTNLSSGIRVFVLDYYQESDFGASSAEQIENFSLSRCRLRAYVPTPPQAISQPVAMS